MPSNTNKLIQSYADWFAEQEKNQNTLRLIELVITCTLCELFFYMPEDEADVFLKEIVAAIKERHRRQMHWRNQCHFRRSFGYRSRLFDESLCHSIFTGLHSLGTYFRLRLSRWAVVSKDCSSDPDLLLAYSSGLSYDFKGWWGLWRSS